MDVIIDDHILLEVLLGDEPEGVRDAGARLYTTGLWYHRLCRAVAQPSVVGAMSRRLGNVDDQIASKATEAITTLPNEIGLISLRDLSWSMAHLLLVAEPLNLISLEALAAAEQLSAGIRLTARGPNPPLVAAAAARGVPLVLI